jgi:predicted nucleic acid-binding protein
MNPIMTQPIFLDTGYIIALVNQRDQFHVQASKLAERYDGDRFLTTDAVLLEIGNALSRNYKSSSIQILNHLFQDENTTIVHLTPEWLMIAFDRYQNYGDQQWGLVDCLSFVVMEHYQLSKALTFDQHFSQAGFQVLSLDRF